MCVSNKQVASVMGNLKILQVISHYVPAYRYGGALRVAHALSMALAEQGHEVRVCTTNLQGPGRDLEVALDMPVGVDGVPVYYERARISRYWGFSPALARRVWIEVAWADVVFLHFHYQFASVVGGWICRLRRKPYIVFTHGSLNHYGVSRRSALRKRSYLALLERGNFRHALFAAYHSQEELDGSFRFGRCRVVPNGIAPDAFRDLPPRGFFRAQHPELERRLVYLYLGRLDAGKGLDLLLPAFRQLLELHPDVHLVLAGGDEKHLLNLSNRRKSDEGQYPRTRGSSVNITI
jgi:glycosyltransferase involved in cell wall biosynthesis